MTDAGDTAQASAAPAAAIAVVPTNLGKALAAGFAAAVVGAVLWAVVTVTTHYQIGFMAIGLGFLVGWAVRTTGRSGAPVLGYLGAVFALAGCILGNLLTASGFFAATMGVPLSVALANVLLQPAVAARALQDGFDPMDLLFYAIAVYEGYKIARRPVSA